MSNTQDQHLVISFESEIPHGPLSSASSSSSSSFAANATTRAMRSATVSSAATGYFGDSCKQRPQFSPYSLASRRCTISGAGDISQHPRSHSPPTTSTLLNSLSSPHRSYHPGPPSSNSPSPCIPSTVLLPEGSPSMRPRYFPMSPSAPLDDEYHSVFTHPPDPAGSHSYTLPPPFTPSIPMPSLSHHSRERELEEEIKELQGRIRNLESTLASTPLNNGHSDYSVRDNNHNRFLLNNTLFSFNPAIGVPPSDWEARTRARERIFCALNRAGNALCAWHDSRRERRRFPPRMAPPRTLNCGCTYEQALFEESLSRNGVGIYWPGDSVRMDPTLRNALLALLEERYNYRDGDFERNPDGTWKESQDAAAWEERSLRPLKRERSIS